MSVTLAYLDDLSRVRIDLADLPDGLVQVERSTNELFWQTVRGGLAAPITENVGLLHDYEFAVNTENFYRVRAVDPPPGLLLPGTSGDYASTPSHASLNITGDIDLRADAVLDDWQSSVQQFVSKYSGTSQRSYTLRVNADGSLRLTWTTGGTGTNGVVSTANIPANTGRLAVRATLDVDNGQGEHVIRFFTAPTIAGPWTQFGNTITQSGTTSIFASTSAVNVGAHSNGTTDLLTGTVYAVEIRDGINGSVVANPQFKDQDHQDTSFADSAGRTWTVNGGAEIIGDVLDEGSITPVITDLCEVWIKSVRFPLLNHKVEIYDYSDLERPGRTGVFPVSGRSFPVSVTDVNTSLRGEFVFRTLTAAAARKLHLTVALGDVLYLQLVPNGHPQLPPRSLYLVADSSRVERVDLGEKRRLSVTAIEVAPPSPQVVGTTLTWGTVFRLYGNWAQLINANPTWADLLALVGSPDDLVVL